MKNLLTFFVLFFTASAWSQVPVAAIEKPFIEVTGTAEKEVVPDIIFITITLKDKVINKNTYSISAQDEKLKKGLQAVGIDLKNLMLSDASSGLIMYKQKEKGVEESKEYLLKVSSAPDVSKVFEMLHNNNIKEAYISKTDHTQIEALRKEVRINAIVAAKDKALYLLEAIGQKLGEALVIKEEGNINSYSSNYFRSNHIVQGYNGVADELEPYISDFKKLNIKYSYYVKYSIK